MLLTNCAILLVFCVVCNLFFNIFCCYRLLWPKITSAHQNSDYSPRTGRSFFLEQVRIIYCFLGNRPKSPSFAWTKDKEKGGRGQAAFREFVGEWVNTHCHPFYWPTCNHWKIKSMTYNQDYPTNRTLKTVISYVSLSRGWTTTRII